MSEGDPGALATWLAGELARLSVDGEQRAATWIAREAIDPDTGEHPLSRTTVQNWLVGGMRQDLVASSYRALANLFGVRRSFIRELVARDIRCADPDPAHEWPSFLPVAARDLSSKGRSYVRQSAEYACESEGLL